MDIIISARHMDHVSAAMKEEIEYRLSKLDKMATLTKAECVMDKAKAGNHAEIVLYGKGINLEAKSDMMANLYDAIHQVCDRIEKQLKKKQGKRRRHNSKHLGELEVEILSLSQAQADNLDYEDEFEEAL